MVAKIPAAARRETAPPGKRPRKAVVGRPGKQIPKPQDLNRLIHERTRLGIVSALAVNNCLTFTELKTMLSISDGNLSVHARRLEEAQYIRCRKSFAGRVPRTDYRLTPSGRRALEDYLNHMEALVSAARGESE